MSSSSRMDLMAPRTTGRVALNVMRLGTSSRETARPAFAILMAIGFYLLNDTIQSILPAIYPFLKSAFALSFARSA